MPLSDRSYAVAKGTGPPNWIEMLVHFNDPLRDAIFQPVLRGLAGEAMATASARPPATELTQDHSTVRGCRRLARRPR